MKQSEYKDMIDYLEKLAKEGKIYCVSIENQVFDEPPLNRDTPDGWPRKSLGKERTITFKCMED